MKKIFMVLIVIISILMLPDFKVNALEASFYEGEYIPGEYIKKFKDGKGKYQQLKFFRRNGDNKAVYCIELWETISQNKNIIGYDTNQSQYANISESTWQRIMLIAYYGYGYKNHTDSKWYVITQFMIWKETSPESNIYFTDTLNGNKISKYDSEMNEINLLIQNHVNLPSFNNDNYQLKYNEKFTVVDTNNVLSDYDVRGSGGLIYTKENNQLTVTKRSSNKSQLSLVKQDKIYNTSPIVYIDNDGQNLMAAGSYYPIYSVVNFYLPTGTITINKIDSENKNNISQGQAELVGAKFQLLDNENQIVEEVTVGEDKKAIFHNIKYGNYTIKEISSGKGYLLNEEIIPIEVNEENENIEFSNQVIKNTLIINKYIKNPITNKTNIEKDASFIILNKNNEIVSSFKTDKNGTYQITLPYGKYVLRQTTGMKNHLFIEDLNIEIIENNKIQTFNLYNEELTAEIKIINIDNDSKLPILDKSTYKIKNTDTNKYIKDKNNEDLIILANKGISEKLKLSSGNYIVEQLTSVEGYELNNEYYKFSINDDTKFEKENNYLEIIIPNIKQKSLLEIEKYIEYYLDNNLINKEEDKNLKITVYAKEDICSKDGIKLYDKDSEVIIFDNSINKNISLVLGNYYIINPVNNEIIDINLDKVETKTITLIDKVEEYTEIETPTVDEYKETESLVVEEIIIAVPNTSTKKSKMSYFGSLLILLGLSTLRKEKND